MKNGSIPIVTILITSAFLLLHLIYPQPEEEISQVCLNSRSVWTKGEYSRLFTSFFFHNGWFGTVFNSLMFLNKGIKVEGTLFSSGKFLFIFILLGVLSNVIYVTLQVLFMQYGANIGGGHLQMVKSYNRDCIMGPNALLFGLNVVSNHLARSGPVGHLFVWGEMLFSTFVISHSPSVSHYRSFSIDNSGLAAAYIYLLFLNRLVESDTSKTKTPFHLSAIEVVFGFVTLILSYYAFVEHVIPASVIPKVEEYGALLIFVYLAIQLIRTWSQGRQVKQKVSVEGKNK